MNPPIVQETSEGTILTVHVQPNASRTEVAGRHGAALKIRVAAAPLDGAANAELVRFLAGEFSVPQRHVSVLSGVSSRNKRVLLKTLSAAFVTAHFKMVSEKGAAS